MKSMEYTTCLFCSSLLHVHFLFLDLQGNILPSFLIYLLL